MRTHAILPTLLTLALASSTAHAQGAPLDELPERYDYDTTMQYVWGSAGGVGGGLLLTGVTSAVLLPYCRNTNPDGCALLGPLGVLGSAALGITGGAWLGTSLSGGARADAAAQTNAALGAVVGMLAGALTAGTVLSLVPPDSLDLNDDATFAAVGLSLVGTMGLGAGLGAAFGYQAAYPIPVPMDARIIPLAAGRPGISIGWDF